VSAMMKRFWASSMEILGEIDRICKKHNIKYFLYYGSLLGAVRHKGFIPWDDDIDIAMLRPDYDKFLSVYKEELPEPYFISHTDDSCLYPACVHNGHYMSIDEKFLSKFHGCPYFSSMDIFVLDYLPKNDKERSEFKNFYMVVNYIAQRTDPTWNRKQLNKVFLKYFDEPGEEDIEEVVCGIEQYSGKKFVRDETLCQQMVAYCLELRKKYYKGIKCDSIAHVNDWATGKENERIPRSYFDELIEMDFMGYKFPVPKEYENVLKYLYGEEYMTPIQGASLHNYPVYQEQAEKLKVIFDSYKAPAPDYFYM